MMKSNPDELSPCKMPVLIEKWLLLIWSSWCLKYNDVFQLFIVFLRNFVVMVPNLWIFRVSIIRSCEAESNVFLQSIHVVDIFRCFSLMLSITIFLIMSWSIVQYVLLTFPFCSFSMILLASIWWNIWEATMFEKILYFTGKQSKCYCYRYYYFCKCYPNPRSGQRVLALIGWFERDVILCGGTKAQKQQSHCSNSGCWTGVLIIIVIIIIIITLS